MTSHLSRRHLLGLGGAALITRPAGLQAADLPNISFSFIQITDTHVSNFPLIDLRQGYDVAPEESVRRTKAAVEAVNECALPYELVVHTGDVAHTRDTDEDYDLARELLQFNKPAYYVPGNHDVGYSQTDEFRPRFEEHFGVCNRAFEPVPGLRFVLFDSQPLDYRAPDGHREEAFARLDELLTPSKPTIFCCHVMGIESFHVNQLWRGWPEETMIRWANRMKEGGVMAVLAGHFHRDELYWVHGLPFYLAGPVVNFWGRQTGFRHWALADGKLTYRSILLEI